jgi:hypothetical protein
MRPEAVAALPLLMRLKNLRTLEWHEPPYPKETEIDDTLDSLAELTQLKELILGCSSTTATARVAAARRMPQLELLEVGVFRIEDGGIDQPLLTWDILDAPTLSQHLSSCSLVTSINMQGVVLDQAGLDLLLAHPHIVDITVMSIAATESRVDSPCSWEALNLPATIDVRTVAYVPLHSLSGPLQAQKLLLPPDVPPGQLAQLLQAAATRMAEHRHMFSFQAGMSVQVTDFVWELDEWDCLEWAEPQQPAFTPADCLALVTAVSPLARIPQIEGLAFTFKVFEEQQSARLQFGQAELQALSGVWGNHLRRFTLEGVGLRDDFFPLIETAFPNLQSLGLYHLTADKADMRARVMLMCQRITRPLTLHLDFHEEQ